MAVLGVLSVAIGTWMVIGGIAILFYVFQSIGLMEIGRRRGVRNYGWAWVPIGSDYVIGAAADKIKEKEGKKTHYAKLLLIFDFIIFGISIILLVAAVVLVITGVLYYKGTETREILTEILSSSAIILILSIAVSVLGVIAGVYRYIALYHVYHSISDSEEVLIVLSIIFNVTIPFFLFCNRHRDSEYYENLTGGSEY